MTVKWSELKFWNRGILFFAAAIGPFLLSTMTMAASQKAKSQSIVNYWKNQFAHQLPRTDGMGRFPVTTSRGVQYYMGYEVELMANAEPDECFFGIGDNRNEFHWLDEMNDGSCYEDGGKPKVNQAYVWGMVNSERNIWFGTAANVQCMVLGKYLEFVTPIENDSWICEFGNGPYCPVLPDYIGDWRPPRIYQYDKRNNNLVDNTPSSDSLILSTVGIRSSGSAGGVIFLAGPSFDGGINFFAFRDRNPFTYLGSANFTEYNDIRKWLKVDNDLYTAVGSSEGAKVLRWTGSIENPFQFEEVGFLGEGKSTEIIFHDGRIFVATWPGEVGNIAGLFMSPVVSKDGLTSDHYNQWTSVWKANEYEPDPLVVYTYGCGALASYKGYLYWGTMHVPLTAALIYSKVYGLPESQEEQLMLLLGTHRAISIFRGRNFDSETKEVELLYGQGSLPAYSLSTGWQITNNKMNAMPTYGLSGFGNLFNNYCWSMAEFDDRLFVGTMDSSYLIIPTFVNIFPDLAPILSLYSSSDLFGADLWYFPDETSPALPVTMDGVDNYFNYGIRNMVSTKTALYLGTANPMNMRTDKSDDEPEGGWELKKLTRTGEERFQGCLNPEDEP